MGLTARCVKSLVTYAQVTSEVIIVDNGSTAEESRALGVLTKLSTELVAVRQIILGPEATGYPKAINAGARAAQGEYLLLMNNDAAFVGRWQERLLAVLNMPDVAIVSPVVDMIGNADQRLGEAHGYPAQVGVLFFVCVLLRRSLFEALGGLDESFGLGNSEDSDFCAKVAAGGHGMLVVDPGVFVTHAGSATFRALIGQDELERLMFTNHKRMQERWAAFADLPR